MSLAIRRSPMDSERFAIPELNTLIKISQDFSYQNDSGLCLGPRVLATSWEEANSDTISPKSVEFLFVFNS